MAYSAEVVRAARQKLDSLRADRDSVNRQRLQDAYAAQPRLREIDMLLRQTMAQAARAAFMKGSDAQQAMEQTRQQNLALQEERSRLVAEHFAPGWLDETPICPHCGGTGYLGSHMCSCLGELCRQEQLRQVAALVGGNEQFSNFRLDYYPERTDPKFGVSPRVIMEKTFKICQRFANGFGPGSGNLLFVGGTGLGKTFLSASIARTVAERGFSVAYETASHLFSKLEQNRFSPSEETRAQVARLNSCDLLIIDDLGTELPGQFVTAALYNLLNDRLMAGKSMVISTNLNIDEMARRYSPQIASRMQGSFTRLTFVGEDIRVIKGKEL